MKLYQLLLCITVVGCTFTVFEEEYKALCEDVEVTSKCTLFGIHIARKIEKASQDLLEQGLPKDEYSQEYDMLQRYLSDAEQEIVLNTSFDVMEKKHSYKKRKKLKRLYISDYIWGDLIKELKKSKDPACKIMKEADIEKINFYCAAIFLTKITGKRRELHNQYAFDAMKNG